MLVTMTIVEMVREKRDEARVLVPHATRRSVPPVWFVWAIGA